MSSGATSANAPIPVTTMLAANAACRRRVDVPDEGGDQRERRQDDALQRPPGHQDGEAGRQRADDGAEPETPAW